MKEKRVMSVFIDEELFDHIKKVLKGNGEKVSEWAEKVFFENMPEPKEK